MKKLLDRCFLGCLAAGLLGLLALTLWRWPGENATSFYENRRLEELPAPALASLWSGEYFTQLDTALSDRIAGRNTLIRLDTKLDLALGRPVVHKVAIGEGAIFPFHGYYNWDLGYLKDDAAKMGERLAKIRDVTEAGGGKFFYLGVPHQYSYYADKYPDYMDDRSWILDEIQAQFSAAMEERDLTFLDAGEYYDSLGHPEDFYLPTDHHYSYKGMLAAYRFLMEQINEETGLNLKILEDGDLDFDLSDAPFLGSMNRQLFGCWDSGEQLVTGRLKTPIPYERWDYGVKTDSGFYAPPTDKYVTYASYMGGDVSETIIRTNRPELPRCLIWGDSFTNAMETVLWASFDETRSLDYRYYTGKSLSDYIAEYQPDVVICLRDDTMYLDQGGNGGIQ